jgi:hypothetical protein
MFTCAFSSPVILKNDNIIGQKTVVVTVPCSHCHLWVAGIKKLYH